MELKPQNFIDNFFWTTALRHIGVTPIGDALLDPAQHTQYCKALVDPGTNNVHVFGTRTIYKKMRREEEEKKRLEKKHKKQQKDISVAAGMILDRWSPRCF